MYFVLYNVLNFVFSAKTSLLLLKGNSTLKFVLAHAAHCTCSLCMQILHGESILFRYHNLFIVLVSAVKVVNVEVPLCFSFPSQSQRCAISY